MQSNYSSRSLGTRAIDLGYSNVKYTCGRTHGARGTTIAAKSFPALAPQVASSSTELTTHTGKHEGCVVEIDKVHYFIGPDAVFNSNGRDVRAVSEDYARSPKYLALLRGTIHAIALDAGIGPGEEAVIDDLVLGLPLSTFAKHAHHVREIAQGEHVATGSDGVRRRVSVRRAHVIVQPHGALLNCGLAHGGKLEGWTLVVDPGGGTLDWYLSSKRKTNWSRSGAYPKAMLACSYAVADRLDPRLRDQSEVIARIDEAIRRRSGTFRIGAETYQVEAFRGVIDGVLEECTDKMLASVGPTGDLDLVLVTGGGASVFHDYMQRRCHELRPIMKMDEDSLFSNVRGFHIYGELQQKRLAAEVA